MEGMDANGNFLYEAMSRSFEAWLERIEDANKAAVDRFMCDKDHAKRISTAPGSREAHHAWKGGYREHLRQTMMVADLNHSLMLNTGLLDSLPENEQFTFSDALTVLFLHDIEKPFLYGIDSNEGVITHQTMTKHDRKLFRQEIIDQYGFVITPAMENALRFVEGVRDADYVPGERADQPLAALCHAADTLSARGFYDFGRL